jgi:hypothetical protein
VVPTLHYPKESKIRIDVTSLVSDSTLLPVTMTIHMVGRQRIPYY